MDENPKLTSDARPLRIVGKNSGYTLAFSASSGPISPGSAVSICAQVGSLSGFSMRLHSLMIDAEIAAAFQILELRTTDPRTRCAWVARVPDPIGPAARGIVRCLVEPLDLEVFDGSRVEIRVRNHTSDRVLPFYALVLVRSREVAPPLQSASLPRRVDPGIGGDLWVDGPALISGGNCEDPTAWRVAELRDPAPARGGSIGSIERADSRIQQVPARSSPVRMWMRPVAGFGWDPFGIDD